MVAEPVEELIAKAVLFRLDTSELADTLAGRTAQDEALAEVVTQLGGDRAQLEELAEAYAARSITMREWLAARKPIEDRIIRAERRLTRASDTDALPSLIGNGQALGRAWDSLNLDRQVAIITALLDHAVIGPGQPGARTLDPARVRPVWSCRPSPRSAVAAARGALAPLAARLPSAAARPSGPTPSSAPTRPTSTGSATFTGTPCAAQDARVHCSTSSGVKV